MAMRDIKLWTCFSRNILISGFLAFLDVKGLGKVFIYVFAWSFEIVSGQDSPSKFQICLHYFPAAMLVSLKAGFYQKAALTSLNVAFVPISRSRFKQRQIPPLRTFTIRCWRFDGFGKLKFEVKN